MRRTVRIFFYLLALLLIGGLAALFYVLHSPANLEAYIASQIQSIVNRQLKPQLSFDHLRYEYPATVHIQNLRLTADDPANPGKTVDIVAAESGSVTLKEMPHVGQPIKIERIFLSKPSLALVSMAANNPDLVGFSDILKHKPASTATTKENEDNFSDVLQIRLVQVSDGKIIYDARQPGTAAMTLDQVNTQFEFTPVDQGWYTLKLAINRKPLFTLAANTQVNLDDFRLRDIDVQLHGNLDDGNDAYLPPQVQELVKRYEVSGRLEAVASGQLPITAPEKAQLNLSLELKKAHAVFGDYQLPIDRLIASADVRDGKLNLTACRLDGFSGSAAVTGTVTLNDAVDSDLKIKIDGMKMQDIFAAREQAKPTSLAGAVSLDAWVRGPLQTIGDRISQTSSAPLPKNWASGILTITDGRLMNFALVRQILGAIGVKSFSNNDTASVAVDCGGDTVRINDLSYVGKLLAARGRGTIRLDRTMDIWLNAGPIERAQVLLGDVGAIIGKVTDNLVAYRVRGTFDDPKIQVEVGNGTVNKVGGFLGGVGSSMGDWFK